MSRYSVTVGLGDEGYIRCPACDTLLRFHCDHFTECICGNFLFWKATCSRPATVWHGSKNREAEQAEVNELWEKDLKDMRHIKWTSGLR